ncbi:uncharacterized protein LOC126738720 [Anthonomus grandis grandis]|uniref:uncharacterized protein LOC126738720 n=1 Tax=Anthonomus grandis grandis TaxID=2921223 RepID=UPI00216541AD|nr:uncharacterized protein LOC126738720 [Anthonomus grandis grandis]
MDYRTNKNVTSFSENVVMAYFLELGSKMKYSTLWANYSMLKATLDIRHDVDISKYSKLRAFLKRQAHASGACRMDELVKMTVQDIQDLLSKLLVTIPDSKTNISRSFIVNGMYLNLYRKYVFLRPRDMNTTRFFLSSKMKK